MKTYYKITETGYPAMGSGAVIPDGYTEYTADNKPQELLDALAPKLEETKAKALVIIKDLRKEKEYSGCISQGILWDTDEKSERRLTSAVTIMKDAGLSAIPNFKPSDKVNVTLTLPMATQAGLDIMIHYGECFAWEDNAIALIEQCVTVDEIKDIVNSL